VAVVLRSGDGVYMGSSAVVFKGVSDPPTLEALACREALALATDVALNRLVIASDCNMWFQILQHEREVNMQLLFRKSTSKDQTSKRCLILLREEIQIRRLIV
jgi:hypothetical protein